jgi:signal transduction histidine kinase/CheY-like chemotaxis protein
MVPIPQNGDEALPPNDAAPGGDTLERRNQALALALSMVSAALESATDGILITDGHKRVTGFNQKFVSMWDLPASVMARQDHEEIALVAALQAADPVQFMARIDEVHASDEDEVFDVLSLADGRVIERFSRSQYVNEQRVGRVWSFRDVTEQRRAEEALRDETRILELLNRTGTLIGSTLHLKTLVQAVTDAATQLSGAKFGALFYNVSDENGDALMLYALSGAPAEAFTKLGHPRATALFGPTFSGDAPIRCDDVLQDPRYGRMGPHHGMPPGHLPVRSYLAVPVISRSGTVIGGLFFGHPETGVFTERTERLIVGVSAQAAVAIDNARLYDDANRASQEREQLFIAERAARAEAERVSRMKDEFLATLSHELRTPLSAMLGWSRVLQLDKCGPEDRARAVDAIVRNANSQNQLIEDLLDMNRIIAGKVRLASQAMNLAGVVDAAVDSIRPAAETKGIQLTLDLDREIGQVSGDPNRLQQVVWNLLSNAIKFTPEGGRVVVGLERIDAQLEITVSDSGIGISPEFLPHVFDRFRQADSSTTRSYAGLGLGLSIVKQLVELHGGSVQANSAGIGQGARFAVQLPFMPIGDEARGESPAAARAAAFHEDEQLLEGAKVLVVDDEQDSRELVQHVLQRCNAQVLLAANATQGLELLIAHRPDVVVSDIGMPGKDGFEFIREVRSLSSSRGGATPAVALTAFARSEDRTHALSAGFQVHVSKPIDLQQLVSTVADLVRRASSSRRG